MSAGRLDDVLRRSAVVLVVGPGGVGKTTIAAGLAARAAAELGRRVLVVTVDPARRLADALGVTQLPVEPVLVPVGNGDGRLWASMVDMARSWDQMVERVAPRAEVAEALLANPLYRTLTRQFVQSHDYIALDQLVDEADDERFDLVIIDTPPSVHAIDILDAPDRMLEFFDSRLLRWLTAPYRSRMAQLAARPFLAVAERLLGGQFLARIGELFWLFSQLQPGFAARAGEVKRRLQEPETNYLLVTTAEGPATAQTRHLVDELVRRGHEPAVIVHNRAVPGATAIRRSSLAAIGDGELRAAMDELLSSDASLAGRFGGRAAAIPVVRVPLRAEELDSVMALADLVGAAGEDQVGSGPDTTDSLGSGHPER